jgi:hypothetical protein
MSMSDVGEFDNDKVRGEGIGMDCHLGRTGKMTVREDDTLPPGEGSATPIRVSPVTRQVVSPS